MTSTSLRLSDVLRPGQTGPLDVDQLLALRFNLLSVEDKVAVRERGRPTPDLNMYEEAQSNGKKYKRGFNRSFYDQFDWLSGCDRRNALFCFPCLMVKGIRSKFCNEGYTSLGGVQKAMGDHDKSKPHIASCNVVTSWG